MKVILKQFLAQALALLVRGMKRVWAIDYRLYAARWIQRLARFLDKTEPGPLFVVCLGCVVGFTLGFVGTGMAHPDANLPLLQYLWIGTKVCFKFGFTGLVLLYGMWEFVQGCKWLNKWAERYQYGKKYTQAKSYN
jgi:hypothetical protein